MAGGRRLIRAVARNYRCYLFLAPAVAVFGVFKIYPMILALRMSFFKFSLLGADRFVGWSNYLRVFHARPVLTTTLNTLGLSFWGLVFGFFPPVFLAIALNELRFKTVFRTIYYLPYLFSWVVTGLIWTWALNPDFGFVNQCLAAVGINGPYWLASAALIKPTLAFVSAWKSLGYNTIIYLAALQTISPEIYEAAEVDGATGWQKLWRITLPLLRPYMTLVLLLTVMAMFSVFDQIYIMGPGAFYDRAKTVMIYVYEQGVVKLDLGYANAMAIVLFVVTFGLTALSMRLSGYGREPEL